MTCFGAASVNVIGVGFGPANLALAIALRELRPAAKTLFFERNVEFSWHPGMLFDDANVQNSHLKDLITLKNPCSEFSFTAYLKRCGRLHRFANLNQLHAKRWEFDDYMRWAAGHFTDQVLYDCEVTDLRPIEDAKGRVAMVEVSARRGDGQIFCIPARHIVIGAGGEPNRLSGIAPRSPRVLHNCEFLQGVDGILPDRNAACAAAVVGAGQSGAEVAKYLLDHYPNIVVHWLTPRAAPRPADDSPYVNDIFMADEVDRHYAAYQEDETQFFHEGLGASNYGVVDMDLLHALYRLQYTGDARGGPRLSLRLRSRLTKVEETASGLRLETTAGDQFAVDCLVLATGYRRDRLPTFARKLEPLLEKDMAGRPRVGRRYELEAQSRVSARIFVQGYAERSHGLGDTLFPALPFRAAEIAEEIRRDVRGSPAQAYPPQRHREERQDRLFETMRRYPFAALISAHSGRVDASHIPLILDETRGKNGVLFGHLDADNPQSKFLDGRELLAVFQGPNAYISPHIYESDQLPTWNFIAVYARGRARVIESRDDLVAGLQSISTHADTAPSAYRLPADERRIPMLIGGIVGFIFEIEELEGRFKLSQDRTPADQARAREVMTATGRDHEDFIKWLHE